MSDQVKLDRPGIQAALKRKSLTMAMLDRMHGFKSGTCRQGLLGRSYKGSSAIAEALGMTVQELWPDCYLRQRATEADPIKAEPRPASQNRPYAADSARAA
jgi:lambda repressor-like predicted transcriptional regulator